ncbi:hypothetical protein EDE08_101658 [Bradyrhizobium sp. R2.2-H]|uniref:hypothetical protein n=1 Tax=unclassified Bradyrhizobium TaxID=2631580 RepID=UPI001046AFDB|nr:MULTISPECIES: hypothetical protein [unclassified Bradyrhizobium]TCU78876.1 hypothetical protein EDE10_101659 [Bradyrhizobium sp. Y-H1]TCU80959.1 hypothetical protein EDE08_101658 [Bradyrhizobium sp. R2.2-H]
MFPKVVCATLMSGFLFTSPSFACPSDLVANMVWIKANNPGAAATIRAGVASGAVGNVGTNQIISGFKTGQSHDQGIANSIDSCSLIEVHDAARRAGY